MGKLAQITSFQNKFSENLFKDTSILSDVTNVTFSGVGTSAYTISNSYNYSKHSKAIEIFADQDPSLGFDCSWNFQDALTTIVKKSGTYIFQFAGLVKDRSGDDKTEIDLEVDLYVNGIVVDTFQKTLLPFDYELRQYYTFAQNFELSALDEVDFGFRLIRAGSDLSDPSFSFCFDGFKLSIDETANGFGLPPSYTLPIYTQLHGSYDYENTLSSQSFTGTALKINNNGAGANTNLDYKFNAIPNIFNTTTNFLEFDALDLGDKVDVRADLTVTTTTANQDVDVYLDVALGTASNYQIFLCRRNFKTAGTYSINDISNWLYIGNIDTRDYNCALMFDSDANATVLNNGIAINVTKRVA